MGRARSNYRQVRVTLTEERGNWLTIRVMVKPVDADWTMRDVVWHQRVQPTVARGDWVATVAEALERVVSEPTLRS